MAKLKVEYIAIHELNAYERNTRTHSQAQIELIKRSISEFGFTNPVLVDEKNVLIAGHGRTAAARELGMNEVPAIRLKGLTEAQRKALRIADNSLALNAGWDIDSLKIELDALNAEGFDTSLLGLDDLEDIAGFLDTDPGEIEVTEDEPPAEEDVEPRCKLGEVWQLGEHRLMCGDATKADDVAQLMDGQEADLLLTDPPYNVAYEGGTKDALTIMNDSMSDSNFRAFLTDAFRSAVANLKRGGAYYIWHADTEGFNFRAAAKEAGLPIRQCLIWVKNSLVLGRQDYQWQHEPSLYGWKPGAAHYFVGERNHTTVVEEDRPDIKNMNKGELVTLCKELLEKRDALPSSVIHEDKPARNAEHPTMKPIKLIARCIRNSTRPGELVLDLFGGSGTTLIAAEQLKRKCRMMELDPKYCDVIIARWEKFTGRTAVKFF